MQMMNIFFIYLVPVYEYKVYCNFYMEYLLLFAGYNLSVNIIVIIVMMLNDSHMSLTAGYT